MTNFKTIEPKPGTMSKEPIKSAEAYFNEIAFLDKHGDFFNMQRAHVISAMKEYGGQFQSRLSSLEAENKELREALERIVSLDNTWADPVGRVKRLAEQALKQNSHES